MILDRRLLVGSVALLLAAGTWAYRQAQDAVQEEQSIRRAAFSYYSSTILGDAEGCLKVARLPMIAIRDGKITNHSADVLRTLVRQIGNRAGVAGASEEVRKQVVGNMLRVFDDAEIRLLGAKTATVVFTVKPSPSKDVGELLAELVLTKADGEWRVIAEITDSSPAPPMPQLPETPSR